MIAEHLTGCVANREETLYEGIRRLPPSHYLLVGPAGLRQGRYWDLEPQREIRYRTDAEYAGHFLTIFEEAVRCRLRSHGRVGAYLSGGMDSSSIVAVVKRLQDESVAPDCGFETFSMVYPGWPCDERAYIDAVIERCQVPANLIESGLPGLAHYMDEANTYQDFPDYPNCGAQLFPLIWRAREKGFRVLLTGNGGNEWLEDGPNHLADLLRGLKLRELVRQARFDAQMLPRPSVLGLILQQGVRPLLPDPLRRLGRKLMGRKDRLPDWLNENYAAQCGLVDRLYMSRRKRRFPRLAQERMYNILNDGGNDLAYALINRQAASGGVEYRHPFNDRRVLEYALAVPETQRRGPAGVKHMLRGAMRPYLPEPVIRRQIQADYSVLFVKTLEAIEAEKFLGQLAIGAQGWVKPAAAIQAYQRMKQLYARNEPGYGTLYWGLWNICAIELWFRQMFLARQTHALGYQAVTGQS
jgi:asparagine synthase (glutamine-hydrolysing)